MKTTFVGRNAEAATADHLKSHGFKIVAQNWRTRLCEIDLVVSKDKVVYFVEVKYRATDAQGDGFEYITAQKLKQMQFAAEVWVNENNWQGDYRLLAAAVSGLDQKVSIIEI